MWPKVKIGDVCELRNGFAFKSQNYTSCGHRIIRITNVQKGRIEDSNPKFHPTLDSEDHHKYLLQEQDILISLTGNVGRVGKLTKSLLPAYLNQRVCKIYIKDYSKFTPDFLFTLLNRDGFENECVINSKGAAQKNLSTKWIEDYRIPLPPLEEQKHIAVILDQAEELRQKRQRSLALLEELKQSIIYNFLEAKRGQYWKSEKLGNLCKLVRGSSPRPKGDPRYYGGTVPRLMISDVTRDGKFVYPITDSLTHEGALLSRPMKKGEVVMAVSGAVGLPAILQMDACIHDGFVGFRDLSDQIVPSFFYEFLVYTRVKNQARSAGAIWKNLTTDQVKSFDLEIPSLDEQLELLTKVESIENTARIFRKSVDKIDELFTSLQHKAFSGELSSAA